MKPKPDVMELAGEVAVRMEPALKRIDVLMGARYDPRCCNAAAILAELTSSEPMAVLSLAVESAVDDDRLVVDVLVERLRSVTPDADALLHAANEDSAVARAISGIDGPVGVLVQAVRTARETGLSVASCIRGTGTA